MHIGCQQTLDIYKYLCQCIIFRQCYSMDKPTVVPWCPKAPFITRTPPHPTPHPRPLKYSIISCRPYSIPTFLHSLYSTLIIVYSYFHLSFFNFLCFKAV